MNRDEREKLREWATRKNEAGCGTAWGMLLSLLDDHEKVEARKLRAACADSKTRIDALIDLCAATWITDELRAIRAALDASPEVLAVGDRTIDPVVLGNFMNDGPIVAAIEGWPNYLPVRVIVLRREGE